MSDLNVSSYKGTRPYIFVSYSSEDIKEVYEVINRLVSDDYRIWHYEGIYPGENFAEILVEKINNCSVFIVFISEKSINSNHVLNEVRIAFDEKKQIVPILLDNIELKGKYRYYLGSIQHAAKAYNDKNELFKKIYTIIPDLVKNNFEITGNKLVKCKESASDVKIPKDVKVIGETSFKNCITLKSLTFNGVNKIENEAFRNCMKLKKITLPNTIKDVGKSAFRDCIELEELIIEDSGENHVEVRERAFENCTSLKNIILPDTLGELYDGVFNSCISLKEIKLPKSLKIIGESAFAFCSSLKKLDLPSSISKIDDLAFYDCNNLEEVKINEGILKLGKGVFRSCKNLKEIYIPKSVNEIDRNPFRECKSLEVLNVHPRNKYYKAVDDVLFNKNKSIVISCAGGKKRDVYKIPDSVTLIKGYSFYECTDIGKIIIPDTVKKILEGAFAYCNKIEKITIPESVEFIDNIVFKGCDSLKRVIFEHDNIKDIGWGVFNDCPEELVVECKKYSFVHNYCIKNNIKYVVY